MDTGLGLKKLELGGTCAEVNDGQKQRTSTTRILVVAESICAVNRTNSYIGSWWSGRSDYRPAVLGASHDLWFMDCYSGPHVHLLHSCCFGGELAKEKEKCFGKIGAEKEAKLLAMVNNNHWIEVVNVFTKDGKKWARVFDSGRGGYYDQLLDSSFSA